MSRLLRLYPPAWRQRYRAEVAELLADRPPSLRGHVDIARGALDAWLHPQIVATATAIEREETLMGSLAATGLAIVSGGLWIAGGLMLNAAPLAAAQDYKDSTAGLVVMAAAAIVSAIAAIRFVTSLSPVPAVTRNVSIAMLVLALMIPAGWPLLLIGIFGFVAATAAFGVRLATTLNQPLGWVLAIAALVLLPVNTEDSRALLTIPLGLAWIAIGAFAFRRAPAPSAA